MPRILGVDIPNDKRTVISLRYIYGIGPFLSEQLCERTGIDPDKRARDLTEDDLAKLASLLDNEYMVEGQLRRQVQQNIARLRDIGCYRGPAAPQGPARARPADPDQRPDPEGPAEDRGGQEGREGAALVASGPGGRSGSDLGPWPSGVASARRFPELARVCPVRRDQHGQIRGSGHGEHRPARGRSGFRRLAA